MENQKELTKIASTLSNKVVEFFKEHGDNSAGVGWFKPEVSDGRYAAHAAVIKDKKEKATLLDFGCGLAAFYTWLKENGYEGIEYTGLDKGDDYVVACKSKFPGIKFIQGEILDDENAFGNFDYIVLCGIFTMKLDISNDEMWEYLKTLVRKVWQKADKGISFNCTSPFVDWEREDLYHLPFEKVLKFVNDELSRDFEIKAHYANSYEYTVIVNK